MTKLKISMFALAFGLAIAGSFAFKPSRVAQIPAKYKINGVCQGTNTLLTNESNCNPSLTAGTQCTVQDANNDPAFVNTTGSTCIKVLFHN